MQEIRRIASECDTRNICNIYGPVSFSELVLDQNILYPLEIVQTNVEQTLKNYAKNIYDLGYKKDGSHVLPVSYIGI